MIKCNFGISLFPARLSSQASKLSIADESFDTNPLDVGFFATSSPFPAASSSSSSRLSLSLPASSSFLFDDEAHMLRQSNSSYILVENLIISFFLISIFLYLFQSNQLATNDTTRSADTA